MDAYFAELAFSTLPISNWAVAILWFVGFTSSHLLFRKARSLYAAQRFFVISPSSSANQAQSTTHIVGQVSFAMAIFVFSSYVDDTAFVFLAGGWVITLTASIALNVRAILFLRSLSLPAAAEGTLTFSPRLALQDQAFQLFGMATFCLIIGALLAHLALFGSAIFIAATGAGYLRRAKTNANIHAPVGIFKEGKIMMPNVAGSPPSGGRPDFLINKI